MVRRGGDNEIWSWTGEEGKDGQGKKTVMGGKEEEDETGGGGVHVSKRRCRGQGNVAEKG